jgi:predicted ATP-dependent endonuclease of OLD family
VFKDNAIIAIEEPEIYLHPHAQRSLAALFDELAQQGNQILFSTHSGNFVNIERFDRICLVEKRLTQYGELSTMVRRVTAERLIVERQNLHPNITMTDQGLRERYRNICGLEHNEALFARKIILVEGETEEYALPIFAHSMDFDFDVYGISVVNAHSKNNLDPLYQLYSAYSIPIYLVFDNDRGGKEQDLRQNEILLRMLSQPANKEPDRVVTESFAILEGNFEKEMKEYLESVSPGKYHALSNEAEQILGVRAGKGILARFMAQKLTEERIIPKFVKETLEAVKLLGTDRIDVKKEQKADDNIPF